MRCLTVILAGILMGSLAIFVRSIGTNPILVTFLRLSFGFIFMLPLIRRIRIEKIGKVFLLALVNTLTILFYISSIQLIEVATSALLLYMAPIYVIVILMLRGEEVERTSILALPISMLGLYLMLSPYGTISIGILCGLLSGFLYAIFFILVKEMRQYMSSLDITFLNLFFSTVFLSPAAFFYMEELIRVLSFKFIWIVGLGIIPTSLAFTILNYGIKYCRTEKAPLLALAEPLSAGFFGYIVFNEILTMKQLIGAFMIILSIFIVLHGKE